MDGADRITGALPLTRPTSKWSSDMARALSDVDQLVYRSNLLGADLAVTNFGGGNTSAKIPGVDPLSGEPVSVLWVKGSGGDLGSIDPSGFARLDLERLRGLEQRFGGHEDEDRFASLYAHAALAPGGRAPSIDTPLHALLPYAHVDHVHPDAVIALAASTAGEAAAREIYGDAVAWTPWLRPGFELALRLRALVDARPGLRGVILAGHGLIAWGETSEACYANTLDLIGRAADCLNARLSLGTAFAGAAVRPLSPADRAAAAST